jgi:hypothetical protein
MIFIIESQKTGHRVETDGDRSPFLVTNSLISSLIPRSALVTRSHFLLDIQVSVFETCVTYSLFNEMGQGDGATNVPETLVKFYQTTRYDDPEGRDLRTRCENLKTHATSVI